VALSETAAITLSSYKETSLQGDSALVKKSMGSWKLVKMILNLKMELNNTPDIAQTIVVTCLGLGRL
jgi:3-phosphoshikimate 1-carboxyvinyltransferase